MGAIAAKIAGNTTALNGTPNVREVSGDETITQADNGYLITSTDESSMTLTFNGPFDAGFTCLFVQGDDGGIHFLQGTDCGLQQREGKFFTAGNWAVCSAVCPEDGLIALAGDLTD